MEVKPGYKKSEVGVIPEEWDVAQISDVCRLVNGRGFKPFEWQTTGLPIIRIQNLNGSEDFNYYSGQYNPKILIEHGQLLFAWSGSRGTSFGPHVWNGGCALLNYHTWKVEVNESSVTPDFLLYALRQLTSYIEDRAHGASALVHTQKWEMEKFPIVKPTCLPEQRAIATALSDVDGLLGGLDRLIAKKRDLKQAAMQQLLTGQTRLPGFHGEWEVKRLGELFNFSGGYSASRDQLSTEGHCYLHYGDIHGSTKTCIDTDADFQNIPKLDIPVKRVSPASLLDDGDVVFVDASEDDAGTSKHVVVVNKSKKPFISGLHTIVAKSKTEELAHEYRRYCFQTTAIRQQFLFYAVGTKVSGISKTNIAKLKLPVPKVPEQTAIAEVLSDMDAELAALEQRRDKTRALKQAVMQELLTGKTRLIAGAEAMVTV
jgi:type I restriction enzyme S subunit